MQDMNDIRMNEYLDELDAQADVEAQESDGMFTREYELEMAKLAAETVPEGYRLVESGKAKEGDIYFAGVKAQSWYDENGELYRVPDWDVGEDAGKFWALARSMEADDDHRPTD